MGDESNWHKMGRQNIQYLITHHSVSSHNYIIKSFNIISIPDSSSNLLSIAVAII